MDSFNSDASVEMPFLSWSAYQKKHNISAETPAAEVARHRQLYRRGYQRHYTKKRRQDKHRLPTEWFKDEYRKLKRFSKRYRQTSLNKFIKHCVFAYLEDEYMEHDTEMAQKLCRQMQAIGNNINQVVHALHVSRDYANKASYEHLKAQVYTLEQVVAKHRREPPKLREQLEQLFIQVPESMADFERFLNEMKEKNDPS